MANPNNGRFIWHELMIADPAPAAKFYEGLLGWTVQEVPMGAMGTYRLFLHEGKQVAGCMQSPPGVPPHWLVYVGVEDDEASARRIVELGGKIMVPPTEVPGMLRFAIAMDPQGAAFGIMRGLGPEPPAYDGPPRPGTFVWDELHTKDQAAAGKYYGDLFGWTGFVADGDPMKYWHWKNADKDIGGMMNLMSPHAPPHWLGYIGVSDVDASTAKVRALGGKVHMEPMEIEKTGKFSVVEDTTGAHFALFRSARV